jgi:single-strand DNA-binding protein
MALNYAMVQGKLGKDPEVRYTAGGDAVAKFSMAVSTKFTDKSGQKRESVYWASIVAWRRLAEICEKYLQKGQEVIVVGALSMSEWEKNGVKMKSTEIVAKEINFTSGGTTAREREQEQEEEFPF